MARTINLAPITRIEGHAAIEINLDDAGNVADSKVHYQSLRGFEKFIEGKPAEEVPRIVNRICGICPWHHHLASNKAGARCFGVTPPPAGNQQREFAQTVAHAEDKLLHVSVLAAPDFVMGPDADYGVRNVIGVVKVAPELATKAVLARFKAKMILEKLGGKAIHPHAGVTGGFCRPMLESERKDFHEQLKELLEFSTFTLEFAKKEVFPKYLDVIKILGVFNSGFLGTVDDKGQLNFYDGKLRMMKPDGSYTDFDTQDYVDYLGEAVVPFSYGKIPYAKFWGDGFSMDLDNLKGIYRANCLARINVCDSISTPRANAELEEFRKLFGRPAQLTLLYHWARLIEDVYAYEHAIELLEDESICDPYVRAPVEPKAGRGVGVVEAPRGSLIHDYSTDENGLISRANLIVGTTHNLGPMNISVNQAAKALIKNGEVTEGILNRIEMAVRAYDP